MLTKVSDIMITAQKIRFRSRQIRLRVTNLSRCTLESLIQSTCSFFTVELLNVPTGASILGDWGSRPLDFGQGAVKYYYILSCTGSMFESGDFLKKLNNLPRSSCKWPIFA